MVLLSTFSLGGALNKILAAGDIEEPDVQPALKKLTDNPKAAMGKVLDVIENGSRVHHSVAQKLVKRLLDNTTLGIVIEALPSLPKDTQNQIAAILNTSSDFDPHLLLPYLDSSLNPSLCRNFITAHRHQLKAAKLLAAVTKVAPGLQDIIFELIHSNIDEPALVEAIALSNSKEVKIRQKVSGIIAKFRNPAAQEALISLSKDHDNDVRLNALHGLVKIEASLPASELFRLMSVTPQKEAALIKALLSHSKDPTLPGRLIEALLADTKKMKSLAITGLSELMSPDILCKIFAELKNKSELTQNSIISSLQKSSGTKFLDAAKQLMNHKDFDIKRLAARTFSQQDTREESVIGGMINSLEIDIPIELKRQYIYKLGEAGTVDAVNPLIATLNSSEEGLLIPTLNALANIGDQRAIEAVFQILKHKDADIQISALKCLTEITSEKFAAHMRDRLLAFTEHLHKDVIDQLIETVETLTTRHNLQVSTSYKKSIESLQKKNNTQGYEFDVANFTTSELSAPNDTNSVNHTIFGDTTDVDSMFNVADDTDHPSSVPAISEDGLSFNVDLVKGLVLNDRYKLIREIGRGGYGSVWLIEDMFLQEEMVMKFLHQQLVSDKIAIERFIRELRLARKITHKNIIRLFDYLDLDKVTAISMEYFDGSPLSKLIKKGLLTIDIIIKITSTACDALHSAHEAGVIHRDMKPANILVNKENEIKIVDFGIAAASKHAESRLTRTGTLIGTPTYISPEQIQGKNVDARTDIYSLGIILYEMLTGSPPYQAEDPMALIFLHIEGNARPITDVNSLVPKALAEVVHRSICPAPDDRFQSMLEFRKAVLQAGNAR